MHVSSIKEIDVQSWSDFEGHIQWLDSQKKEMESQAGREFNQLLFRGQGNSQDWSLETTLERSFPVNRCDETLSLLAYYRKALAAKPFVETLAEKDWSDVPDFSKFQRQIKEHRGDWLDLFLRNEPAIYSYLIYLRHHGFPSPLLDWTASPYIAALFAFDGMDSRAEHVCLYAFLQDSTHVVSGDQHLFLVGHHIQTDRRHFLQQCRYTMCVAANGEDYTFRPHENAMLQPGANAHLFKFRTQLQRERRHSGSSIS